MELTNEQLVEILGCIAGANAAVINAALDRETVSKKVRPALLRYIQSQGEPSSAATLDNLYSRMLLFSLTDFAHGSALLFRKSAQH